MANQIWEQLKECKTLPTLPGVAVELLTQFQNCEVNLEEIAGIIRKDPALAAKVLGFVNSPFCGVRKEVTSIHHAVALLGLSAVQTIALSFSLIRGLRETDLGGFDFHRFWRRSILAAAAARALGAFRKGLEREQLFLSGLLQDIGMLALQSLLPKEYGELNRLAGRDHSKLHELEKDRLGTDHAEAGRWLAEYWHLPSIYRLAIQSSHDPEQVETDEEHKFMFEYVALSGWLAEVWLDRSESLVYLRGRAWTSLVRGLNQGHMQAVASEMRKWLGSLADLFEVEVGDPETAVDIMLTAREQLISVSLGTISEKKYLVSENEELRDRSFHDPLTGLFNRAYLDQVLLDQFVRDSTLGKPTSVIFCDIDDFKKIKDSYGHKSGDLALTSFARLLRKQVRQQDPAVRLGGDEFVVVLPGIDADQAFEISRRIQQVISDSTRLSDSGAPVSMTISVGHATHNQETPYRCLESLCYAADQELYKAKSEKTA